MQKPNGEQKSGGDVKSPLHASQHAATPHPSSNGGAHHAYPKPSPAHPAEENAPHCDARYLNADRLANLVTEFRELSQRVVDLEQQKKQMGYFN